MCARGKHIRKPISGAQGTNAQICSVPTHTHTRKLDLKTKRVGLVRVHTCAITIALLDYAQFCQVGELAEGLNTSSELVVVKVPESGLRARDRQRIRKATCGA